MNNNKGFSMVELIIVIAIMAILAGFLAPALTRYINRARLSSDIDTGRKIADAMAVAAAEEKTREDVVDHTTPTKLSDIDGAIFKKSVSDILGGNLAVTGKSKKDVNGDAFPDNCYYYVIDVPNNIIIVYYGGKTDDYQVYPNAGAKIDINKK